MPDFQLGNWKFTEKGGWDYSNLIKRGCYKPAKKKEQKDLSRWL